MYYKGGNMLHMIRQIVDNDQKWHAILQGLNRTFWHQTVTTQQIESYISEQSGIDLSKVFDQYLRTTKIPLLQYRTDGSRLLFKYDRVVPGFAMPVRVIVNGKEMMITPTEAMQTFSTPEEIRTFAVDRNYYVQSEKL
jgi:aminopeptidase N